MGKKQIPDRWLNYQAVGDVIEGTNMFAFKVPLKRAVCESPLFDRDKRFTPEILLERCPDLKTVIDLTNTARYYNPQVEFTAKGVDHVKITVEGHGKIPTGAQFKRFAEAVREHAKSHSGTGDALIGVHCTHGLNRTGYFICRWMVDYLGVDPDDAIQRFNQARGHPIERQPYLDAIRRRSGAASTSSYSPRSSTVTHLQRPPRQENWRDTMPRRTRSPSGHSPSRSRVYGRFQRPSDQDNWRTSGSKLNSDQDDSWRLVKSGRNRSHRKRDSH